MLKHCVNTRSRNKRKLSITHKLQIRCKEKNHFPSKYHATSILPRYAVADLLSYVLHQQWEKRRFSLSYQKYNEKQILSLVFAPNVQKILHRFQKRKSIIFSSPSLFPFWTRKRDDNSSNIALDVGRSAWFANSLSVLYSTEWLEQKFSAGQFYRAARDALCLISSSVWFW